MARRLAPRGVDRAALEDPLLVAKSLQVGKADGPAMGADLKGVIHGGKLSKLGNPLIEMVEMDEMDV